MSKLSKNMDIVLQQGPELIEFYRNNPCIAAYELLGVDLAPIQRVVFEAMWFKPYVLSIASRGFGKTFLSGVLAALLALLYPGYRVGLISASFRQCLVLKDSTFWTNTGLHYGEDFYKSILCDFTKVQSFNTSNTIKNKWLNPKKECLEIISERGFKFIGTLQHKVLTFDSNLELKYKEIKDITYDTVMVIKKGFNLFGINEDIKHQTTNKHSKNTKNCSIPNKLTEDFAYWLGLIIGDGSIEYNTITRKYRVNFYSSDEFLTSEFKRIGSSLFGLEPWKDFNRSGNVCSCFNSKTLLDFLFSCGVTTNNATTKHVPHIIKSAPKKYVTCFLSGLFDTDGNVSLFTDKDNYTWISIGFTSSSYQLSEEVKSMLLNIGIMSSSYLDKRNGTMLINNREINKNISYDIVITGYDDIILFNNNISFRLERKQKLILQYINNKSKKISNTNKVPFIRNLYMDILIYMKTYVSEKIDLDIINSGIRCCRKNKSGSITYSKLNQLLSLCDKYAITNSNIQKLKNVISLNLSFVKPKNIRLTYSDTFDIEVCSEHCYFANGFIHHNSKMIFSEVEKIYTKSPIIREATEKRPIRGSDTCYLKFKSLAGYNGSFIEALPIGADGAKIRGSRFYCILVDEFAQVPQKIIETVLAPMSITKLDPMKKVRELERRKALIEAGLATDADFEEDSVNKMIGTSSGYYKFNHMYKRMREYWHQIDEGSKDHAVFQVPYTLLPEGFLDPKNVENSRRVMSNHEFEMEYMAAMVSDSEGFFKASVLELCTSGSDFNIEFNGDKDAEYVIGIDPNQGGKAKCGVVIVKLGKPNKIVRVLALDGKTTQDITVALQDLCNAYNVKRIFMDRGGGGKAVSDLLEEGYNGYEPIIEYDNKDKIKLKGRHILALTAFSTSWIADANFATLSLFEDRNLLFPQVPTAAFDEKIQDSIYGGYDLIEQLKRQCLNIIVTQTSGGALHFDTPKKGQNKDLYSALILAGYGVKVLEHELGEDGSNKLYSSGGLVRNRNDNNWKTASTGPSKISTFSGAVPKKRI